MVVCPFGDWVNCQHLVEYLKAKPFAYRDEMQAFVSEEHGLDLSESTMTRVLERMKYTRKAVKRCPHQILMQARSSVRHEKEVKF